MICERGETVRTSEPLRVGDRLLFVISRVLTLEAGKGKNLFGALVSPIALIILEADQQCYAFPLGEGKVDIDALIEKFPQLAVDPTAPLIG
jgi:hypothetical protein